MLTSKWHLYRMGLVDFWYYVDEEFLFEKGHMLLRGSNGSGKSVTMQSFIPLLLDGNKSSERLDSFGTRSRKIENYLLEEDDERDDRIGYLYLEFKREDADIYKTIGMGLHARRNKPVDAWYFVIEDNRRIRYDIELMENNLAITKQVLKRRIGSQFIDGQKEYMDRVNHALFHFPTRNEYREAINLLMQLRSPKLSNALKPTMINEILSNSLQPLSEDDLRPMSEAISNMDEIKDQLDGLKQSFAAAKSIAAVYEEYNYASLDKKASAYLKQLQVEQNINADYQRLTHHKQANEQSLKAQQKKAAELRMEQDVLQQEQNSLLKQDVLQLVEEVKQHKKELDEQRNHLQQKQRREAEKDNQRIDAKRDFDTYENKKLSHEFQVQKIFHQMDEMQEIMQFEEHRSLQVEVMEHLEQAYDFSYTQKRIREELKQLQGGLGIFQKISNEQDALIRLKEQLESYQVKIEQNEVDQKSYQEQFVSLQEEYKESFAIWNKENQYLKLSHQQLLNIMESIQNFADSNTYRDIDELIRQEYMKRYKMLSKKQSEQQHLQEMVEQQISEFSQELLKWQQLQDPTPEIDESTRKARNYLQEQGIEYRPFYEVLNFSSHCSADIKNKIEEKLQRMGLLNSLLVHIKHQAQVMRLPKGMAEQFLFINQNPGILQVREISEDKELLSFFHHLGIADNRVQFSEYGYQNGILSGIISRDTMARFIGKEARERYREEKITELNTQLTSFQNEKHKILSALDQYQLQEEKLKAEYRCYRSKDDLESAKSDLERVSSQLNELFRQLGEQEKNVKKQQQDIQTLYLSATAIADHLGVYATKEAFEERSDAFRKYEESLHELKSEHQQYQSAFMMCNSASKRLMDAELDLDEIRYEITETEANIEKQQQLLQVKEQQVVEQGYEDVKQRIDEIVERLQMIPNQISDTDQRIGKLHEAIKNGDAELLEKEHMQIEMQAATKHIYNGYLDEAKLGYVIQEDREFDHVADVHAKIASRYPSLKGKESLGNELQTKFYQHRGYLQEYNLSLLTVFEAEDEGLARLDIKARYKGVSINFLMLLENLQRDIEKQSILLEDSDRTLIEDILVNTISRKVRTHIQNSKHWVEVMNRYMNAMDTSSGLKLSLQWRSHKAENDEELSSEHLVKLLEKDVRILKDSDRQMLSSHFRSKINKARKMMERQDNHDSFHTIMKTIMDYRTWFDFRILYEKAGEKKKELTNTAFYAFSGGEKAMSMYVPLFSAVAAKFEGADEDAPLLIALDEAFAGVDEKNIMNMFALIDAFQFDYIMNSQVLWGDYPSVNALAIYELFRPENAHYVTIISYLWNGHQKSMVDRG